MQQTETVIKDVNGGVKLRKNDAEF